MDCTNKSSIHFCDSIIKLGYYGGMGFFNAFKNIVLGKPVFEAPPQKLGAQSNQLSGQPARPGPKVIPQLYIERVSCKISGGDMEVDVVVQNYSKQELFLDKIVMLGTPDFLNSKRISPGEEDSLTAYHGDRPEHTNDSQCQVFYKNEEGDYFCSEHTIEYGKLPDNSYMVKNIRFAMIRDV